MSSISISSEAEQAASHPTRSPLLWLSYQRYALLLLLGCVYVPAGIAYVRPGAWYLWLLVVPLAVKCLFFAREIASHYPKKRHLTAKAQARIDAGTFDPSVVRDYCTDPCFRVVASEVLRRSGVGLVQRFRLIAQYSKVVAGEANEVVTFDFINQRVTTFRGGQTIVEQLPQNPH